MHTHEELKSDPTLVIESMKNTETNAWEVTLNDSLMGTFSDEQAAADATEMIYSAFETGYVNGLLLGFEQNGREKCKEALESRGVTFKQVLRFQGD